MSCVYVHPESGEFWVIDDRFDNPEVDGKTKLDHVDDMLQMAEHR